jgi:hypothetical protein
MKLRIDRELHEQLRSLALRLGVSESEVVRRCLRYWLRNGRPRVATLESVKTATRDNSTVLGLDLPGWMMEALEPREIRAIIRWRLAGIDAPAPAFQTNLREGVDYTVAERE